MVLTNNATISSYTYPISSSTTGSGTATAESLFIDILPSTINFTKENTPNYIAPGNSTTITYTLTNQNPEDILTAEINDPVFSMLGVTATVVSGGTISGNKLTVELTPTLKQNETKQVVVNLAFDPTAAPDKTLYDSIATATFVVDTSPSSTVSKTAKGLLEVNEANLWINKTVSPTSSVITAGNLLTFTVEFTNSGNVDAYVGIGHFVDSWTPGLLTNINIITPGFSVTGSSITNNLQLYIPAESSKSMVYTGIAV